MTDISLTQNELKLLLDYNPVTGIFTRRVTSYRVKSQIGDIVGCLHDNGYLRTRINYRLYYLHRLAFLYMLGIFPPKQVDHINHLRTDNRWENLRHVTHRDNARNRPLGRTNKSGYFGVYWKKDKKKWAAQIRDNNSKLIYLGIFTDLAKAVTVRKIAENKYGYHLNHGN